MSVKRADSHWSAARIVRPHGWQKKPPDEKNVIGAKLETPLARQHRTYTCQYYDTIAGKMPQRKRPPPTKSIWRSDLPMCETCGRAGQPNLETRPISPEP